MMDYTIFGESHGPAVGVLLRDVPPGLPVDEEFICRQLLRRAPQDPLSTARHEPDQVEVLSGVYQGVTTGMPVCLLLRNPGQVLSREQLIENVWGYAFTGESRTVDVHVRTLRQKLGEAGAYIETVRGYGYKISPAD